MKVKVGDYVQVLERTNVLSRGWVDKIKKGRVDIQSDDGYRGNRGFTVNQSDIAAVLPEKPRPLAYWKRELCLTCDKLSECDWSYRGMFVAKECPYITEMVVREPCHVESNY